MSDFHTVYLTKENSKRCIEKLMIGDHIWQSFEWYFSISGEQWESLLPHFDNKDSSDMLTFRNHIKISIKGLICQGFVWTPTRGWRKACQSWGRPKGAEHNYSVLASLQCFGKHPFVDGNIYTFMPIFFICLASLNMLLVCFKW